MSARSVCRLIGNTVCKLFNHKIEEYNPFGKKTRAFCIACKKDVQQCSTCRQPVCGCGIGFPIDRVFGK